MEEKGLLPNRLCSSWSYFNKHYFQDQQKLQ